MEETLSLSWDTHQNNICRGLSLLQQRGEFVDMTLAADGHHVKVHQMVVSLVSPYIKDLISTAKCSHPVIFLNVCKAILSMAPTHKNISYTTLSLILEYIYTGEVQVPKESLPDLIAAGKALHIKGLREMDSIDNAESDDIVETPGAEKTLAHKENNKNNLNFKEKRKPICKIFVNSDNDDHVEMEEDLQVSNTSATQDDDDENTTKDSDSLKAKNKEYGTSSRLQYTISNQGNMQVVLNRYIYNLKYVQKNLNRYWRCVDYGYRKCPANVYTNDKNVVVKRKCSHNHPFHDVKILKKIRLGLIFNAFNEAKDQAETNKGKDAIQILNPVKFKSEKDDNK